MENKKKMLFISLILVILIVAVVFGIISYNETKTTKTEPQTSEKTKLIEEFAKLNGKKDKDGNEYTKVDLSEYMPYTPIDQTKMISLLEKQKTAIVFVGNTEDEETRVAINILTNLLREKELKVYYFDIKNIESKLELDENGNVITTNEGTKDYQKIVELLKDNLSNYYLTKKDGTKVDTNQKHLSTSTLIALNNSKVVGIHEGIEDFIPFNKLTTKQEETLIKKYKKVLEPVEATLCNSKEC